MRKMSFKRCLGAVVLGIVVLMLAQAAALVIGEICVGIWIDRGAGSLVSAVLYVLFALAGVYGICRFVIGVPMERLRITVLRIDVFWGVCAVVMPLSVVGVYMLLGGHWENSVLSGREIWKNLSASVFLYGLAGGIVEEIIFRGLIMGVLEETWNKWVAVLVPSLFGALHIIGNDLDFLSMVQLVVAGSVVGILFSMIAYFSGSVWNSAVVHGCWNAIIGLGIIHVGVSADKGAIFNFVIDRKSFLLSGGDFGIEASVVSVAVYLIFAAVAVWRGIVKNDKKSIK